MVKVPVGPIEHQWTSLLGSFAPESWDGGESWGLDAQQAYRGPGAMVIWWFTKTRGTPSVGSAGVPSASDFCS